MVLNDIFTGNTNMLVCLESEVTLLEQAVTGTSSRQNGAGEPAGRC